MSVRSSKLNIVSGEGRFNQLHVYMRSGNEVYGIRDQRPKKGWDQGSQPRIRDHSPRDRDQRVFH